MKDKTSRERTNDAEIFLEARSPLQVFENWFGNWLADAKKATLTNPNAMVLATVGRDGHAHSRVVLLKSFNEQGLVFFTNYESQKGKDLSQNPNASLTFYWDSLHRQVHLRGLVEKTSRADSETYWNSRPRMSQIASLVSAQSRPVESREEMDRLFIEAEDKFKNKPIPCPEHWGGFRLSPNFVEFWIGREGRFHDRYAYQKVENRWSGQRLYP